jgi:hypothetical protein
MVDEGERIATVKFFCQTRECSADLLLSLGLAAQVVVDDKALGSPSVRLQIVEEYVLRPTVA